MSRPPSRTLPLSAHTIAIALVLAIGLVLSIVSYRQAREAERVRVENEFFRRADVQHALTREILANYESGLLAMRTLFKADTTPPLEEFQLAAREVMARYPGISVLEWVAAVSGPGRSRRRVPGSGSPGPFLRHPRAVGGG